MIKKTTKEDVKNQLRAKIIAKGWSVPQVAEKLGELYRKDYSGENLNNKLRRGTIQYKEVLDIAEIIGFKIKWIEK